MSGFNELWRFIVKRSVGFPTVQEYSELEHVFNKMHGCKSYLEVGTAEGNSLYVLSHALAANPTITCVDFCEPHTQSRRQDILDLLASRQIKPIVCPGDSTNPNTLPKELQIDYDCVLIDGGHTYDIVKSDAAMYGRLAKKYIFFHDITIPDVDRAFTEYCAFRTDCKSYRMVNSTMFGYGIMEIQ